MRLFAPEGSAEGCASGECLPEPTPAAVKVAHQAASPSAGPSTSGASHARGETSPRTNDPANAIGGPALEVEKGGAPNEVGSATAAPRSGAPTPAAPDEDGDDEPARPASRPTDEAALWRRAVDAVREASPRHGKSLSYARFLGFTPEGARIAFPPEAGFHRAQVTGMSRAVVEAALARALKRPIKLVEDTGAQALQTAPRSIAEEEASDRASRERAINDKVRAHPALRTIMKHLGGALEHVTVLDAPTRPLVAADEGDAGPPVD